MIRLTLLAVFCLAPPDGPSVTPAPEPSYEQMRSSTGRDADAQVKLALWCESHGLEGPKVKHLAMAVLADPSNAMARGLLGLVEYGGRWKQPEAVADAVKADVKHADLMAEYNGRRVRAPVKPDAQWKLALWCEGKGLKDEARAHLATVVRLDANHAEAWKRLGYKKVGNRWVTDARAAAEKTERQLQQEADKRWRPRLEHLREALDGKGRRKEEALREMAMIADPRAVPAVWHAFVERGGNHQVEAVQVLGQIDAIEASRALAMLAVSGKSDEVRRRATETLRRRDPREWADLLIVMLREKVKYEVKKVGGPVSPGELYVEGEKKNLKRIYAPPPMTFVPFLQGDTLETDASGSPVLVHHERESTFTTVGPYGYITPADVLGYNPPGSPFASPAGSSGQRQANEAVNRIRTNLPQGLSVNASSLEAAASAFDPITQMQMQQYINSIDNINAFNRQKQQGGGGLIRELDHQIRVPVGQMMAEARRAADSAQNQLQRDVDALNAYNKQVADRNGQIVAVLQSAAGESLPAEPKPWRSWYVDQLGFQYKLTTREENPTVVENVPLEYQPKPVPVEFDTRIEFRRHSCFGEGTLVRTLAGPRPVETIEVGDLVLSQDTRGGKLGYRPVVMAHHNPPSPTFEVALGGAPVVTSPSHRFWVAGRGWVMARDLKVGDPVRTLGGVAKVAAIETGEVQPVFNLDVEGDADFFVGEAAALVHDNTLPDLKQQPFDAPPAVAAK